MLVFFHNDPCTNLDNPSARSICAVDTRGAVYDAAGGKIRTRNQLNQIVIADIRGVDDRLDGFDDFAQVVRGDIGGHSHGNTRGAVYQQRGKFCRENCRFG